MRVGLDMNFSRRTFLSHGKNMEAPSEILDPTSSISTLSSTAACHTYESVSMSVSRNRDVSRRARQVNFGKIHGPYVLSHTVTYSRTEPSMCGRSTAQSENAAPPSCKFGGSIVVPRDGSHSFLRFKQFIRDTLHEAWGGSRSGVFLC